MAESDSDQMMEDMSHVEKAAMAMAQGRDPFDTAGGDSDEEEWILTRGDLFQDQIKERAEEIKREQIKKEKKVKSDAGPKTKKGLKPCPPGTRRNPKTKRCVKSGKPHSKKERREEKEHKALKTLRKHKYDYPKSFLKKDGGIKKNCLKKAAAFRKAQDAAKMAQSKKKHRKGTRHKRHSKK